MTPVLEARGVELTGRLHPTDLQLAPGEMVAVMGPNGSGKTSLLRGLAGIERTGGDVSVEGEDIDSLNPSRRPYLVTYLPASRQLVWPISVRDVIALGLPRPDPVRVNELIELLELAELAGRPVDRLSTGERARVLFARTLAPRPRLLLLDEPLSNLDPYWVLRMLEIIREAVDRGASALVALHDIERATAFDRALLIDRGRLIADLPPKEMLECEAFAKAYRIERRNSDWRVRPPEDRRSSP
jgi:iron complex transport system ATP-binding protein